MYAPVPAAPSLTNSTFWQYSNQLNEYNRAQIRNDNARMQRSVDRQTAPNGYAVDCASTPCCIYCASTCPNCCPEPSTNTCLNIAGGVAGFFYLGFLGSGIALTMGVGEINLRALGVTFQACAAILLPGIWYFMRQLDSSNLTPTEWRKEIINCMALISIVNVAMVSTSIAIFVQKKEDTTAIGVSLLLITALFCYGLYRMYKNMPDNPQPLAAAAPGARANYVTP